MKADVHHTSSTTGLRILIVDDHPLFLAAMTGIFHLHVPSAHVSVADCIAKVSKSLAHPPYPDLVFLDLQLPDSNGLATFRAVFDLLPKARFVVLSGYAPEAVRGACLELGAHAVLDKTITQEVLVNAVLDHTEQLNCLIHKIPGSPRPRLTRRQHDVLALITQGYGTREVAMQLFISEATVKSHTTAIFRILGVRTRAELIAMNVRKPSA